MTKRIIYQVDSFTKNKFSGNPAGVVLNADGLTETQMLQLARELNNSETAFLFKPDDHTYDGIIRYFTPKTEVPTCGHATVAAMYARAIEENLQSCTLKYKTKIGILPFEILKTQLDYKISMTQGKFELSPEFDPKIRKEILDFLSIAENDLAENCPVQIAGTGHSKVFVGIKNANKLSNLKPDFNQLAILSHKIKCNGYFTFTFDTGNTDILTRGRMFAPAIGINEDPVTGNANGPLGGYLIHHHLALPDENTFEFKSMQGVEMGRSGIIDVKVNVENNEVKQIKISGDAVNVFKTEIEL